MATEQQHESRNDDQNHNGSRGDRQMYLRFGAMVLTSMVIMYAVMYMATWEWSHLNISRRLTQGQEASPALSVMPLWGPSPDIPSGNMYLKH